MKQIISYYNMSLKCQLFCHIEVYRSLHKPTKIACINMILPTGVNKEYFGN